MRRSTIAKFTKFSVEELQRAVCDPLSCVAKVQSNEILGLRPSDCEQITRGVRRCVTDRIGSYHPKVAGIVLGYAKIRIENTMPAFRSDSPYLHVRATIDYFVFRPRVGSTLRGIVNYVSKDFVSAVMFQVFNVTVKLTKPRSVKKDSEISFIVQSCDMKSQLPIIEGELVTLGIKQEPVETEATTTSPVVAAAAVTNGAEKRPQSTEEDTEERPAPKKAKKAVKQKPQPSEPTEVNGSPEGKEPSDDDSAEKSDLIRSLMASMLGKMGKSKSKKKSKKSKDNASSSSSSSRILDVQEVTLNADIKQELSIETAAAADQSTIIGASTPIVKEEKRESKKRKIRFNLPSEDTLTPIKTEHRNGGVALQNGKNGI
uniref:Putative dna-dependent rna polymerase i n=1 Tax=Anopheles marajoara TaxID=58244 RepID=A0A2M4BRG9_9DIPT